MVYNPNSGNNESDDEFPKEGIYNEAQLKILRLNKESEIINFCKKVQLKKNELGEWNFLTEKRSIGITYSEIKSKLKKEEIAKINVVKQALDLFLEKHPVMIETNKKTFFDEKSWKIVEALLEEYDSVVKEAKDKHGFGMPDKPNPRRAAAKR